MIHIFVTVTDLVNVKHVVTGGRMLNPFPRSCLVHAVNYFVNEGWCGCDSVIISVFNVLCVCWQSSEHHFSEKMQFMGFLYHLIVQKYLLDEVGK